MIFPDHQWDPWKFAVIPDGFFHSTENARRFFEHLLEEKGVNKTDLHELYHFTYRDVRYAGGGTLLKLHGSLFNAIKAAFPEKRWDPEHFSSAPRKSWQSAAMRKQVFERMRVEIFGPDSPSSSLAALSYADIVEHNAASLLAT